MRKALIVAGAAAFVALAAAATRSDVIAAQLRAEAAPSPLLQGCTDVPEAVALADTLRQRGIAVDRALADLDRRKQELAAAEQRIKTRLDALKSAKAALGTARGNQAAGTAQGIDHLIAVYDAMKPVDAATILAALPPDFAAEILARVQPETGARIIASIEPGQAAILTARMGSRRLSGD